MDKAKTLGARMQEQRLEARRKEQELTAKKAEAEHQKQAQGLQVLFMRAKAEYSKLVEDACKKDKEQRLCLIAQLSAEEGNFLSSHGLDLLHDLASTFEADGLTLFTCICETLEEYNSQTRQFQKSGTVKLTASVGRLVYLPSSLTADLEFDSETKPVLLLAKW